MPPDAASRSTVARVIPSGQAAVVGVARVAPAPPDRSPGSTMNRWVALVWAMKPRLSSMTASPAPASFASILARIEVSRLLWWILGSSESGAVRRTLDVTSRIPARSYTGSLNSASTISVGPETFSRGSMPEVSLTPRVRVSRMCTPVCIPLAASVRMISAVIASSAGTEANPSAWADRRSRSRCSSSAKIRPLVSRRPSQTASPPCTTESNGDTPASSRCDRRPPTLTIRSRLRSSNFCSNVSLPESAATVRDIDLDLILTEPLVVRQALLQQRLERRRELDRGPRPDRGEPGRAPDAVVPVRRPHPVGGTGSGRPRQHRGRKWHAEGRAQLPQPRLGGGEQVGRVDDRPAELLEQRRLLPQPQVGHRRRGPDASVGGQQRPRLPDQERVAE